MQLPLMANQLATLGNGAAVVGNQQQPQPQQMPQDNPGILQAQLMQQEQQRKLADSLMKQGYIPNSGGLGALAMVASAWKGKKMAQSADEKIADATKRLFEAQNAEEQRKAAAALQAEIDKENRAAIKARELKQAPGWEGSPTSAREFELAQSDPNYRRFLAERDAASASLNPILVPRSDGTQQQMLVNNKTGQFIDPFNQQPAGAPQGGGEDHSRAAGSIAATIEQEIGRPLTGAEKAQIASGDFNIKGGPPQPVLGVKPAAMAAGSEDERKAAGWVDQAQFAFNNMEKALQTDPAASKPGKAEALNQYADYLVPDMLVDASQTPSRQQYAQASSSFAEAALRAATGAGVNKEEAAQKVKELTPQPFDSPQVVAQKREALQVYLGSLQSRSGRAIGNAKVKPIEQKSSRPRAVNPKTGQAVEWNGKTWVMAQ